MHGAKQVDSLGGNKPSFLSECWKRGKHGSKSPGPLNFLLKMNGIDRM